MKWSSLWRSRRFRDVAIFVALTGAVAAAWWATRPRIRGDVVLVVVDTLRADHLPIYGYERETAPVVRELAERGAVFEQAFSHSGWTLPSVASLMTGRYPHEHRARFIRAADERVWTPVPEDFERLAEIYRRAGYRTGAFINNPFLGRKYGFDQGFDHFDEHTDLAYRSALETVGEALRWLSADPEPAFLVLHFMEPHLPYRPPRKARHSFTGDGPAPLEVPYFPKSMGILNLREEDTDPEYLVGLYDEEILGMDQALRPLVEHVDTRPGEPLYVYTADHGEEFWDHGKFEHGHTLFGELTRVPLVIAGDPRLSGRYRVPVGHVDLFQYLADVAGLEADPGAHGTDLVSLARQEERRGGPWPRAILHDETLYEAPLSALSWNGERVIVDLESGETRLYRYGKSGQYEVDVTDEVPEERVTAMRERLRSRRGSLEPLPTPELDDPQGDDSSELERLRALGYVQ